MCKSTVQEKRTVSLRRFILFFIFVCMSVVHHLHIEDVLPKRALGGEGWCGERKIKKNQDGLQLKVKKITKVSKVKRRQPQFQTPVSTVGSPDDLISPTWIDFGSFHDSGTPVFNFYKYVLTIFFFFPTKFFFFSCLFWSCFCLSYTFLREFLI